MIPRYLKFFIFSWQFPSLGPMHQLTRICDVALYKQRSNNKEEVDEGGENKEERKEAGEEKMRKEEYQS